MNRKNRLFLLALSVFLPPICIMLLAAADLVYSQRSVETLARSYVEDFTRSVAGKIERDGDPFFFADFNLYKPYNSIDKIDNKLVNAGHFPGQIIILDNNDGTPVYGSKRLEDLVDRIGPDFPYGVAFEFRDAIGDWFTVCAYPARHFLVIGAILWSDLPGTPLRALYFWPFLICVFGLWSSLAIWRLWRRVIIPLGELESEISALKWGEEELDDHTIGAIYELEKVRTTISKAAKDSIRRVTMIRTYLSDLVNIQEDERTKISRDIHDGPLQDVTALIQRIYLARRTDNTEEDTVRELDLAEKIAMATVKEMRALCDFLNPPWLELGLEQALTELTERQSAQYSVKIFLYVEEELDLPEAATLAFFRVVQEAVTNSVKHGETRNIWIDVNRSQKGVELTVQDDGIGFEIDRNGTEALRVKGHRGLSNMEERVALVGGVLKIISYPGEGTCIRVLIP